MACNHVILLDLWWAPAIEVRLLYRFETYRICPYALVLGASHQSSTPDWPGETRFCLQADCAEHDRGQDPAGRPLCRVFCRYMLITSVLETGSKAKTRCRCACAILNHNRAVVSVASQLCSVGT